MKTRLAQETKLVRMFKYLPLVAACLLTAVAISACGQPPAAPPAAPTATLAQTQVERGKMLVIGGACHDCHTPKKFGPKGPEPDMDRMLSGHPEDIKVALSS